MNFIIINPDEMRHNTTKGYGNPAAVTPNIDKLAKQGTLFENCFVQHTVCSPSRASFLTGLYPHNRGHRTLWNTLGEDEPNLFSYLKQNGYDVHIWGKNDVFDSNALKRSATSVNYNRKRRHGVKTNNNRYKYKEDGYYSFLYENDLESYTEHPNYASVQCAVDYLNTKPENPFCIFLPISLPHCPYQASKDFEDIIDPNKIPELKPYVEEGKPDFYKLIRKYRGLDKLDNSTFKEIMRIYLSMVSMVDKMTGDLLEAVSRNGFDDNTAIIFFSDHGDWAGDYGLVEKWPSGLDDCLTHVPFIIKAPGYVKDNRITAPVEMFDMFATVLDLAGIKTKHTHFAKSLVPQLKGQEGDLNRIVFAEGGYDTNEPHCFEGTKLKGDIPLDKEGIYYPKGLMQQEVPQSVCRSVMARTLEYKLVRRTKGQNELYDLKNDPNELKNLYNSRKYIDIQNELENKLLNWYLKTSDTVPVERKSRHFDKKAKIELNSAFENRNKTKRLT